MKEIKFRAWNIIVEKFQYFTLQDIEKQKGKIQWHILKIDQYTGLKDKNGKEIYEGDIETQNRVFTYDVGMGGWYLMKNGEGVQWHSCVLTHGGTRLPYEIIGNIHQHENLLK